MSSAEENNEDGRNVQDSVKKRRIQRACDICRRKKIRCDGAQMPNNRCSNCITYSYECTYVQTAKKRGPPKGYVENLENRVQQMEALLKKIRPDIDVNHEIGGPPDRATWISDRRQIVPSSVCKDDTRSNNAFRCLATPDSNGQSSFAFVDGDELSSSDDELVHSTLTEGLKRLAVQPMDRRFLGKSSGIVLIQAAINLKRDFVGDELLPADMMMPPNRRTEFWVPNHWETVGRREVAVLRYPPDDLLSQLLDNYFTYANPYHPILHRPSFERAIADGRHINDNDFGTVVLMVCALGARWSNDPRVMAEPSSKFSRGWKYFEQCHDAHNSILLPPRLYDLQVYALCSLFLLGSSSPQAAWTISGVGIRLAQDVGAHRRKVYKTQTTVESELWKRAFWCLVSIDRMCSLSLGRPCAIQDEDFDLDMPLEVDDAYWENVDRAKAFKQPSTIVPTTAYFNCQLKLNQILAFALRTIYSINKSKILLGFVGSQWEQHIVAELDSALNKWIDTVPEHLRWDPHRENFLHFSQSAMLYISYYHLQIIIHRPFIPSPRKPSPLSFPSLAICTNAARSCSHIADFMRKRGATTHPFIQIAIFTAGIVLLLNMWGAKKSGVNIEPESQMADVYKCMRALRQLEDWWPSAGRLWDILNELAFVGDIPLQAYSPAPTNKRDRDEDSPRSATANASGSPSKPSSSRSTVARNDHVSTSSGSSPSDAPIPSPPLVSNDVNPSIHENHPLGDIPPQWFSDAQPMFAPQYNQPSGAHFDLFQNTEQVHGGIPVDPIRTEQSVTTPVVSDTGGLGSNLAFDMSQFFGSPEGYTYQTYSDPNALLTNPEALQMWSAVPTSFDLAEWGNYLDTVTGTSVVIPEVNSPFPSNNRDG